MGIKIETVKTGSFSMDYFQFGHGNETLVILPGLSVQSVMNYADDVAAAYHIFKDYYTIYVFDRRKELPASYTIREMAEDTVVALWALELEDVNLFGASQGGMITMKIAAGHPSLIKKLILGSTSSCMQEAEFRTIEEWIGMAKAGAAEELYLAFGEAVYPKDVFELSCQLLIDAAKTVTEEDLNRFVILAEGMKGFDMTVDLGKIACPVLVIGSMDDQVVGAEAAFSIAKKLSGQKGLVLSMYDGYGHAAYDTAPDYKERMLRFLIQG